MMVRHYVLHKLYVAWSRCSNGMETEDSVYNEKHCVTIWILTVRLGHTLEFVLLLDGVTVAGSLGGVDQLVGQALGDGLDVTESSLPGSGAQQPDSLIDPPKGRDIDGLTPNGSLTSDTGGVLTGSGVDDGIDQDLEGVLSAERVDDLEAVLNNPDGHQLLAVVSAVHHEGVHQPLHDGALGLPEPLGGKPLSGVGKVDGELLLHGNVILEGHVSHMDVIAAPPVEEHDLGQLSDNLCGGLLNVDILRSLNLVIPICFRHFTSLVEVNQAILAWSPAGASSMSTS